MAPRTRRALFSVTLFLATCAVLGSLIGGKVAAQSASDESTLRDSLHEFTDVYSIVEQNYAEPLDAASGRLSSIIECRANLFST